MTGGLGLQKRFTFACDTLMKKALRDPSLYLLLAVNIALICGFYLNALNETTIIYTYYFQSIILGFSYFFRIMTLKDYSVENFKIDGVQAEKSPKTKGCTGWFFLFHFGFFHFVYLIFLLTRYQHGIESTFFWTSILSFAAGECLSIIRQRNSAEQTTPNIGTLMFTPYLRIIPMHFFILLGGFISDSKNVFLIFLILKTFSDVLMHIVVSRTLQSGLIKKLQSK